MPLDDDEFRLLAYLRGYADKCGQGLDPSWIQEQLEWSPAHFLAVARRLDSLGLVALHEYAPQAWESLRMLPPELPPKLEPGPHATDIRVTQRGWNYLRR